MRRMLSTPGVRNKLLPYGSVITKTLRHFRMPLIEPVYIETKKLRREAIIRIVFYRKNGEWAKITLSENQNTLVASRDDRVLNDVYPADQLPDFKLRARPHVPGQAAAA